MREKEGRDAEPTAMIIDCQLVKSAEGVEAIGFDGGKKVQGRKRVLLTHTFAWMYWLRRIARDYERTTASSESFIYAAMIRLGLRVCHICIIFNDCFLRALGGNIFPYTRGNFSHKTLDLVPWRLG